MTREQVTVEVFDILDLVACSDTYGHGNDVVMDGFAQMLGYELCDDDIAEYAAHFLTPEMRKQGYSEEDAESCKASLTEWRDGFVNCGRAKQWRESRLVSP